MASSSAWVMDFVESRLNNLNDVLWTKRRSDAKGTFGSYILLTAFSFLMAPKWRENVFPLKLSSGLAALCNCHKSSLTDFIHLVTRIGRSILTVTSNTISYLTFSLRYALILSLACKPTLSNRLVMHSKRLLPTSMWKGKQVKNIVLFEVGSRRSVLRNLRTHVLELFLNMTGIRGGDGCRGFLGRIPVLEWTEQYSTCRQNIHQLERKSRRNGSKKNRNVHV